MLAMLHVLRANTLTHADTVVQLISNAVLLVTSSIVLHGKGGVVGGDFGNVAVFPVAELGVVVAGGCVGHGGSAAGSCRGHGAVRVSTDLCQLVCVCRPCDLRVGGRRGGAILRVESEGSVARDEDAWAGTGDCPLAGVGDICEFRALEVGHGDGGADCGQVRICELKGCVFRAPGTAGSGRR